MRWLAPLLAPLWVPLLLAACGSLATTYYTLTPVPSAQSASSGPALKPPIEVGQVSLPAIIDRDAIVVAGGGGRLDISSESVWGAPLGEIVRRALFADLTARLPRGSVLPPGDAGPRGGPRTLTLNVQQFGGDTSGRVVLQTDWTLTREGGRAPPPHRVSIEINAGSGKPAAIVPAMSRALGELADRIAATIR
ncbi:MAG: PqiC family protein [Pseudomonadota bacterium]|nr:PqiC family protein [Pseudomonadota bacterium]